MRGTGLGLPGIYVYMAGLQGAIVGYVSASNGADLPDLTGTVAQNIDTGTWLWRYAMRPLLDYVAEPAAWLMYHHLAWVPQPVFQSAALVAVLLPFVYVAHWVVSML